MSRERAITRHRHQSVARDLARFHYAAGARVALRANGVIGAAIVFVFGLDMDALAHLRTMVLDLVARHTGSSTRALFAVVCVTLAGVSVRRVMLGATGWLRSLPVSSSTSRRAVIAALCAVQAFTIAVALLAILGAVFVYRAVLDPAKLAGIALMIPAAAALVLPVEHRAARAVALGALLLTVPGRWSMDFASAAALVASDVLAGRIVPARGTRVYEERAGASRPSPTHLWIRLTSHAILGTMLVTSLILPALFVAFGYAIVLHNPDLDRATAMRTVRVTGMLALTSFAGALATSIVRMRPAWAWVRSLPWSARQRVTGDAVLIGVALCGLGLALLPLDPRSAAATLLLTAPLAAGAAAATRIGARRQTSAAGEIVLLAVLVGTPVVFWPWASALGLVLTPVLFAAAVRRERRLVVTRWEELHHDAAGDPAWIAAS